MRHADSRSFEPRRLAPGDELHLTLQEGDELFCCHGRLDITAPQQPWPDGMPGPTVTLSPGQGWRAGSSLRIRIRPHGPQAAAGLQLWRAPEAQGRTASEEGVRPRAWRLAGWLRGFRRGQRAA